ncbi:MAG: hypothetical protein M1816_003912 [Peltula sp. TS41687]|nr:MAG: hypothetical protein M1816_003912 [Peltula sp. TS41687]
MSGCRKPWAMMSGDARCSSLLRTTPASGWFRPGGPEQDEGLNKLCSDVAKKLGHFERIDCGDEKNEDPSDYVLKACNDSWTVISTTRMTKKVLLDVFFGGRGHPSCSGLWRKQPAGSTTWRGSSTE